MIRLLIAALAAMAALPAVPVLSADLPYIVLQSTTSTRNSGLYDLVLPKFEAASGFEVRVVAVGTGQALMNAARCDGDVVITHDRTAEESFVADGYGVERFDLMHNDFVIVGPAADPASIADSQTAAEAFSRIAGDRSPFVSRGDLSGTHRKEQAIWGEAGIEPEGVWYMETGAGMGAALNMSVGLDAYTLSDRATWVRFRNKLRHALLFEGGADLANQYGIIAVSPAHCPGANSKAAGIFVDWMLSEEGRAAISLLKADSRQLFRPGSAESPATGSTARSAD